MPHCVLEFSSNIVDQPDLRRLLGELHDLLVSTGLFDRADIKSRAVRHEVFLIGDGAADRSFVTLDISILDGRTDEAKAGLTEGAHQLLERHFPRSIAEQRCSITVRVSEIHRASYRKLTSGG